MCLGCCAEAGGWAPYCVLGVAVERRGCVGIVHGAGCRGSVTCGVAQCAHLGTFRLVFMFLYFRCSLDVFLLVSSWCLCAAVYGVIKNNNNKYCDLAGTHLFFPVAIETAETWNQMAVELVQEIGRRITLVTEDSRETVFLFQRLSIALQQGNAVSFLNTFTATD